MCARIIRLTALLGCLMLGSPTLALAQADQQRVALIMSKLPPQKSAAYKQLKARADKPTVQVLALSKSEIWSVPAGKVDTLTRAAARRGVKVMPFIGRTVSAETKRRRTRGAIPEASREPRDDWNQIFRLAPADIKMNDKQKQLMQIARASQSTVGVGVMAASFAPMVEYALTKDAGAQSPSRESAKITVALSQGTVLTINRTSVDIKPRMCIWHGSVEGTDAPATIIWWPDGKMAGSVQHQGRLYSIRHLGGEMHAVVEMSDEKMPQEHAPMPQRLRAADASLRDDRSMPLSRWSNASSFGNMACLFTSSGAAAQLPLRARVGKGINVGVAAPWLTSRGWKDSFFGDLHAQARDATTRRRRSSSSAGPRRGRGNFRSDASDRRGSSARSSWSSSSWRFRWSGTCVRCRCPRFTCLSSSAAQRARVWRRPARRGDLARNGTTDRVCRHSRSGTTSLWRRELDTNRAEAACS